MFVIEIKPCLTGKIHWWCGSYATWSTSRPASWSSPDAQSGNRIYRVSHIPSRAETCKSCFFGKEYETVICLICFFLFFFMLIFKVEQSWNFLCPGWTKYRTGRRTCQPRSTSTSPWPTSVSTQAARESTLTTGMYVNCRAFGKLENCQSWFMLSRSFNDYYF